MPPKKHTTYSKNIKSYFKTHDPGSSSFPTMGAQPGGAAGPQPGGAPRPGGAPWPGGAAGPQPGGAPRPGGAEQSPPGEATGSQTVTRSQVRVKEENNGDSTGEHLHRFTVKFSPNDKEEYNIYCAQPRTVLEAIKSSKKYQENKFTDENIVIQLGNEDKTFIVATHFPCSCISEGESLFISCESEKVEVAQQIKTVHSRDTYSVFYIDRVGGLYTKQKKLFISSVVKQFKYLCVYGEKGMTVEEALKRDGRFINDLNNFTLSDNEKQDSVTECKEIVDNLDGKKFKIRLPRNMRSNEKMQETPDERRERDTMSVLDVLQQRGTSVTAALENNNIEEIYRILREQFQSLKELMESRFPDDSYQKTLNLRREDFGKIQQSFSEVHRVRKLIELGESVCKVVVKDVCQGTGFVLFDNFILTNAHLLKDCVEGGKLKEGIEVYFLFNYEDPEPHTKYYYFPLAHNDICYSEDELDYAILEINPQGQKYNPATPTKQIKVPPGLLKKFGPLPQNGEACIIGHPAGGLKKMDPTCIIEKEKREQAVHDHLHPYKDNLFIVSSIMHLIKKQGFENIMMGGKQAEKVATYNTFMYHGSSGSPVFDAHGRVFGLHTAGYSCDFLNHEHHVIEFAQPLLTIFQHFVSQLKQSGNVELLNRVEKEAQKNPDLKKVLNATSTDDQAKSDGSEDTDEPMTF